ncbi:hypothetical protein [Streptosporangium sp. KLBMP 9127]
MTYWPIGTVCQSCYTAIVRSPAECACCHELHPLIARDEDGSGLCVPAPARRRLQLPPVRPFRQQYAHVSPKVTLNCAGEGDTSWMDDLAVEKLEMLLEQNDDDHTLAEDGEHISGPSATEYRSRLGRVRSSPDAWCAPSAVSSGC